MLMNAMKGGTSMLRMKWVLLVLAVVAVVGCSSQSVPPAHKARLLNKTGMAALWMGGNGFDGPVMGPGTYYTGVYNEYRAIDCSQRTLKEELTALTSDGVQFSLDLYISYGANCDDDAAVNALLSKLSPGAVQAPAAPDPKTSPPEATTEASDVVALTITAPQIYGVYVRPALGESVREEVSHFIANDVNAKRDEIFDKIRSSFEAKLQKGTPRLVTVYNLNLSNLDFPDAMEHANTDRAVQAILKDKAIAERERVEAEIKTTDMRKQLAQSESNNDVVRIESIGKALHANPEYLQYDLQSRMQDIYFHAGEHGNMIIAAPPPLLTTPTAKK